MNDTLIRNWNNTVTDHDRVFLLGDVTINKKYIPLLGQLNGTIFLVLGNHDNHPNDLYTSLPNVKRLCGCMEYGDMILTHIPVHKSQFERFLGNVHGHLHYHSLPDPRYFNVSVERINYTPIKMDVIREHFRKIRPNFNSLGTNPSM
jgi:calcineurin-like phosphoesterase family protein